MKVPVSPAMLNVLIETGPSTLDVPRSKLPILLVLPSATVMLSSASVKISLTGFTVIVAVFVSASPEAASVTVYVKVSVPLQFASGV